MTETVEVLVPGGKGYSRSAHWPCARTPSVSTWKAVVDEINKKTADFNGMQVPVTVTVDEKRNFTIDVGIPPTAALIMKEAGIEKGAAEPGTQGGRRPGRWKPLSVSRV